MPSTMSLGVQLVAAFVCVALASPPIEVVPPVETAPDDGAAPNDVASDDAAAPSDDAPAPVDETAPVDQPEPPRSVFAPTPPPTKIDPIPEAPLGPGVPGGYWDSDRSRGREPPDGEDETLAGSIILPLGILSASSSAAIVWLSVPGHCQSRWKAVGGSPDADQCKGVYAFGWIRVAYGSLMVITGAALLGVGLHRRRTHERWERGYAHRLLRRRLALDPWLGRGQAGLAITLRFGGGPRVLR